MVVTADNYEPALPGGKRIATNHPNRESSTAFITRERDHGESHALQNKYGGHASGYCGYTTPKMYSG